MHNDEDAVLASSLMRIALTLLNRCGETICVPRLQHALDALEGIAIGEPTQAEIDRILGPVAE